MGDDHEHKELLGELKAHAEYTKDGITEIKDAIKELTQNTRENVRDLHKKGDAAHDRIDDLDKSFSSHKSRIAGFTAAIGALWAFIMSLLKD